MKIPDKAATGTDRNSGVSAPVSAPHLPVGFHLDEAVCKALGIPGWPLYYAAAPQSSGTGTSWFCDDFRISVEQVVSAVTKPTDWRFGSVVREQTLYPSVSASHQGYYGLVLEKVGEWPFWKRRAFTTALSDLCRVPATPPEVGFDLVGWPDAMIEFRAQLPEFICRAALEASRGAR